MRGTQVCRALMGTPAMFKGALRRPFNRVIQILKIKSNTPKTNISSLTWAKYLWRNWDSSSLEVRIRQRIIRGYFLIVTNDMVPFNTTVREQAKWECGWNRTCSFTRRSRPSHRCSARAPIRLLILKTCSNIFIKTRQFTIMLIWTWPNNSIVNHWQSWGHQT